MSDLNEINVMWLWLLVIGLILLFVAAIAMRAEEKAEKASKLQNADIAKLAKTVRMLSSLCQVFRDQTELMTRLWEEQLKENEKLAGDIRSLDALVMSVKEDTEKELEKLRAEGPEGCTCRPKDLGLRNVSGVHDDRPSWQR